jgi:hypothetical protein
MQRNVTVCLDEETIAKARVVAAKRRTSLSGLLVQEISRLAAQDEAYAEAKAAALRRMARGAHLGGGRLPARESLHDR